MERRHLSIQISPKSFLSWKHRGRLYIPQHKKTHIEELFIKVVTLLATIEVANGEDLSEIAAKTAVQQGIGDF